MLIFVILGFVAIAYAIGQLSRKSQTDSNAPEDASDSEPLTANEALPSQTGRFRVQQVFGDVDKMGDSSEQQDQEVAEQLLEDDEALPDPFERED